MRSMLSFASLSLLMFGAIAFVFAATSLGFVSALPTPTHTRSESFEIVNASTTTSSTNAPNTTTAAPNTTTAAPNTTIGTPIPAPVYSRTRTVEPETTNATAAPTTTTAVATNASTTAPNTTTAAPNTTTAAPNTTTVAPNTTTVAPNTTTAAPNTTTSTSTLAPPPPTTTTTTTSTTTTTTPAPPVSSVEQCKNEYILYSSGANPSRLCDTYNCLEAKFKCQSEAEEANRYLIDYAKDRCVRRERDLKRKLKSNSSLTWLSSTRQCLQKTLVDNIEDSWTCSRIASFGYKSQWPCFTTSNPSGISLCDLRTNEQVKIAKELRGGLGNACSLVRESVDGFQNCHKKVLRYAKVKIQVKPTARLLISILRRIINLIKNRCSKLNIQVLGSLISKIQERSTKATCTAVDDDDTSSSSPSSFSSSLSLNRFANILSNHEDESLTGNFTLTLALAPNETSTTIDDDLEQLNNDPIFNSSSSSDSDLATIISNAVTETAADTVQVLSVSEASSSDYGEDEDTSNRNSQPDTSSGLSTAAATGTAIGVVVVVVLVALVTLYIVKKGKNNSNDDDDDDQTVHPSEDHEMTSLQMP